MKQIPTVDAVGHVLCHDITRIVRGVMKDAAFTRGHVVTKEDIPLLLALGKESLYIWEAEAGMLHENDAAEILYKICADEHMQPTPVKEGKIEVVAMTDGLLRVDVEKLRSVNALGDMMIAARHTNFPVKKGDRLAGTRIIPLTISQEKMKRAQDVGGHTPILKLYPYAHKKVGIITTGSEVYKGLIQDDFTPVIREKLVAFSAEEIAHVVLSDSPEAITANIRSMIQKGADLVICTGGMSIDPDDKTPLAIKNTGAQVVSYGTPVFPGAMFLLAYHENRVPVVGLPGCVMYSGRTIFDLMLPRIMADVRITASELTALGHGGFCLSCPECVFPACSFGAGV